MALVLAGCGGRHTAKTVVPSHDCFAAWNASGNEANRADLAGRGFAVGSVESSMVFGDPAPGGTPHEGEGCGYLFHSDTQFVSYTGDWRRNTLLWTNSMGRRGPWTAVQQHGDDARVLGDGRIAKR